MDWGGVVKLTTKEVPTAMRHKGGPSTHAPSSSWSSCLSFGCPETERRNWYT